MTYIVSGSRHWIQSSFELILTDSRPWPAEVYASPPLAKLQGLAQRSTHTAANVRKCDREPYVRRRTPSPALHALLREANEARVGRCSTNKTTEFTPLRRNREGGGGDKESSIVSEPFVASQDRATLCKCVCFMLLTHHKRR